MNKLAKSTANDHNAVLYKRDVITFSGKFELSGKISTFKFNNLDR